MSVNEKIITLYMYRRLKKRRRQYWVHPMNQLRSQLGEELKIQIMYENYPAKFFQYTRMSPKQFDTLLELVNHKIRKFDTNYRRCISSRVRLYVTLRFLATGDSIKTIATNFSMGNSTIWKIINDTVIAIWDTLAPIFVKVPTIEEWTEVVDEFESKWNFPNCFGAVDGKHVVITAPPMSGSVFHNYKGTFSIVLLAACDANYCFTMVDVGACGRQSDGGTFANSTFGKGLIDGSLPIPGDRRIPGSDLVQPCTLVGDEGFGLSSFMMRPYPGNTSKEPKKRIFNYRLSRARRIIENVFGILASRFRIYQRRLTVNPDHAVKIVKATIALHNFLRKDEDVLDPKDRVYCPPGYVDQDDNDNGDWRNEVTSNSILQKLRPGGSNNYSNSAKQMRDNLANFFVSENGSVPWQNVRAVIENE